LMVMVAPLIGGIVPEL